MNDQQKIDITLADHSHRGDWDTYVENHPAATPYHRFAWMVAVERSYSHKMHGLLAKDSAGTLVGVLPMINFSVPLKGKSFISLPYCDLGFALADSDQIKTTLLRAAVDMAKNAGAKTTQIRGVAQAQGEEQDLEGKKVRMLLALPESAEALMSSFKSKLRSQIRKAEKNGLIFKTGSSPALIDDFYDVYSLNMRDLGSPAHAKKWFQAVVEEFGDQALVSVVYSEDVPVGAGIVLRNGTSACIPWASTVQAFNRLAPNMLLYWSVLGHCADNGVERFDFGRSTFNEGTFKFKKQWGAQPELLQWHTLDKSGNTVPEAASTSSTSKLRTSIETVWRKLPASVATKVGSTLRPYISL